MLVQRQIRRNEFTAANTWQWFSVDFDNPCFGQLEARIWWHDTANMKFREIQISYVGSVVNWLITDHLGTPRMVIDQAGSLTSVKRHDYLPFGEELLAPAGGRSAALGYAGGDGSRQQFTLKERDVETGLDYFDARYLSSIQGRFTTVDPENAGAALRHPQSWNGYAYSLNNPFRFIDPNGLRWAQVAVDGGIQYQWFDDEKKDDKGQTAYDRAIAGGWSAVVFDKSGSLSFTNGLLAPGETLTTVTLNENSENPSISTHTVTWGEWLKWYTINAFLDPITGGNRAQGQLEDFLSSIVGTQTQGSLPSGPLVPGPSVAPWRNVTPSRPLDKMGHASKHLKDFQKIDPSLTEQDVAKILEHVRQTGASSATKFGGKAFEGAVNIGGKSVTVKVIESAGGVIKTGYPVQ